MLSASERYVRPQASFGKEHDEPFDRLCALLLLPDGYGTERILLSEAGLVGQIPLYHGSVMPRCPDITAKDRRMLTALPTTTISVPSSFDSAIEVTANPQRPTYFTSLLGTLDEGDMHKAVVLILVQHPDAFFT